MGRHNVHLAGVSDNFLHADGRLSGLIFPQNYVEFSADGTKVTWTINVRGVAGSPSSWQLRARFLDVVEHTYGPQYSEPQLVPFTELQTQSYIREKAAWGKPDVPVADLSKNAGEFALIADNTDGLGSGVALTVTRTVEVFNRRHKLELAFSATGGTDPAAVLALSSHVH